jgi:hypothetical protein
MSQPSSGCGLGKTLSRGRRTRYDSVVLYTAADRFRRAGQNRNCRNTNARRAMLAADSWSAHSETLQVGDLSVRDEAGYTAK